MAPFFVRCVHCLLLSSAHVAVSVAVMRKPLSLLPLAAPSILLRMEHGHLHVSAALAVTPLPAAGAAARQENIFTLWIVARAWADGEAAAAADY